LSPTIAGNIGSVGVASAVEEMVGDKAGVVAFCKAIGDAMGIGIGVPVTAGIGVGIAAHADAKTRVIVKTNHVRIFMVELDLLLSPLRTGGFLHFFPVNHSFCHIPIQIQIRIEVNCAGGRIDLFDIFVFGTTQDRFDDDRHVALLKLKYGRVKQRNFGRARIDERFFAHGFGDQRGRVFCLDARQQPRISFGHVIERVEIDKPRWSDDMTNVGKIDIIQNIDGVLLYAFRFQVGKNLA
jgi:hypothetical protein